MTDPSPERVGPKIHGGLAWATTAGFVTLALIVRAWSSQGPLWLDELWSLDLVRAFGWRSVALVFDNNHPLNTIWINVVSPDASPGILRLPGILASPLIILAVGLLFGLRQPAAVIGMAMASVCMIFAVMGSEARGYGLMLAMVFTMLLAAERGSRNPQDHWRLVMALAVLTGLLAHPLSAGAAAAAGTTFICLRWMATGCLRTVARDGLTFLGPSLLAVAALGSLVLFQALNSGARLGDFHEFALFDLIRGWLSLQGLVIGLSTGSVAVLGFACLAIMVAGLLHLDRRSITICLPLLLTSPILMAILQLPNTLYPRYHLVSGCGMILMIALLMARYWSFRGYARAFALLMMLGWLAGQLILARDFQQYGRGDFQMAIETAYMRVKRNEEPVTVGADSEARGLFLILDAARRAGLHWTFIPSQEYCARHPTLYIDTSTRPDSLLIVGTEQGCPHQYSLVSVVRSSRLNGMSGGVYLKNGSKAVDQN